MPHCILLSHVFIRDSQSEKIEFVEFALQHWRQHNPSAYIVVTGHGNKPDIEKYCDHMYWPSQINEKDINVGHPHLVNVGLAHIMQKGYKNVLKSRADTIHAIPNIVQHSKNLLENKKLLVTQQTSIDRLEMGDLFLYGNTELMAESFNEDKWYPTKTGLRSLARIFLELCKQEDWHSACIENLSFVDIFNLRWIDFRNNWHTLKNKKNEMLNNNLVDEHKYYWGATEKWHVWDSKGNLIYSKPKMGKITTKKDWK
jgi:hypothetical protein